MNIPTGADVSSVGSDTQDLGGAESSVFESSQSSGGQQDQGQGDEASASGWDSDERFESQWGGDPNKLYSELRQKEKEAQELSKYRDEATRYQSQLAEKEQSMAQYQKAQQLLEFFEGNPEYKNGLMSTLEQIEQDQRRVKYGDLPEEAIQRLQEAEAVKQELQEFKTQQLQEKAFRVISDGLKEIGSVCKENGLQFNEEKFLGYCKQKNIPPEGMSAEFYKLAHKRILQSSQRKASVDTAKKINGNITKSVVGGDGRNDRKMPNKQKSFYDTIMGIASGR